MKTLLFLLFAGIAAAQNPGVCSRVLNTPAAGQVLSATNTSHTPPCQWINNGGGGGSISLSGSNGVSVSPNPITGTGTISGVNAAADGTTKGVAAFAANDFNATTGVISIDYTNGQAASGSAKGFLTAADWTTFNSKAASGASTTVNGQTCALGSSCAVTVAITTGVTGLGSNVATFLATPSGANLASALTTPLTSTGGGLGAALNGAAAHSTVISNGASPAVYSAKVIADCQDTGGNHLNFTQSTDAFSCGTSYPGTQAYYWANHAGEQAGSGATDCTPVSSGGNLAQSCTSLNIVLHPGVAGTAKNLYVTTGTSQPAMCNFAVTLRLNGSDTALTVSIPGGSSQGVYFDTTHAITGILANDGLTYHVTNGTCTSAEIYGISMQIT